MQPARSNPTGRNLTNSGPEETRSRRAEYEKTQANELEAHNAQLLGKLIGMVAENMAKADRAKVEVSAADQVTANLIKTNAVMLESDKARAAFQKGLKAAMDQHGESASVSSTFGQFAKMF